MMRIRLLLLFCTSLLSIAPASAAIYEGIMLGSNENPQNTSTATGFTSVMISGDLMTVDVTWSGLTGGLPGAAHIHCCIDPGTNVGVAVGFPEFPSLLAGTYTRTFDLLDETIYTAGFRNNFGGGTAAGAKAALIAGLDAGRAYSNIHNMQFGGGEIRANLAAIPEPSTAILGGAGLCLVLGYIRRKRTV